MDLDVLQFNSLMSSVNRQYAIQREMVIQDHNIASQGSGKEIDKHVKSIRKSAGDTSGYLSADQFLADVGSI